ncbi:MAG: hypothetical protein KF819_32485 [Labilithrix sp.]|nr:hypothetical protein [Labilithrix sp.]
MRRELFFLVSSLACFGLVECQTVTATPDPTFPCEQRPEVFCATEPGGCPTEPTADAFCAWLARRGTPKEGSTPRERAFGSDLNCSLPDTSTSGYTVDVDGGHRSYLLDEAGVSFVMERLDGRPERCLAGPPTLRLVNCISFLMSGGCGGDAGSD